MRTVCIVQARLGSTRLPAKVLLPLPNGRVVLQEVIHRCRQIKGIDDVVCAIPDTPENDILLDFAKGALVFRGPEHDVLKRYTMAAEATGADAVMRITSDCPLIDPAVCGLVLYTWRNASDAAFYTNNAPRTYPHGLDCEVFAYPYLRAADQTDQDDESREHVTAGMRKRLPVANVANISDQSHLRWTLDTLEDYVTIWNIFQNDMREAA